MSNKVFGFNIQLALVITVILIGASNANGVAVDFKQIKSAPIISNTQISVFFSGSHPSKTLPAAVPKGVVEFKYSSCNPVTFEIETSLEKEINFALIKFKGAQQLDDCAAMPTLRSYKLNLPASWTYSLPTVILNPTQKRIIPHI